MKIAIEAQRLFRRKKHGMEIVALELIKALQKIDHENQYTIFVKPDEDADCLLETDNFRIQRVANAPYPVWEQYLLPRAIAKERFDLLHCTSNTAPVFTSTPMVVTVHDIIYLESLSFSGSAYQNFGNLYRRFVVPSVMKKSKSIITVSHFEKERIAASGIVGANKIFPVYNAKNRAFELIDDEERLRKVKETYQLPDDYILFFGNTAPKKNTRRLLEAYCQYTTQATNPHPLVITDIAEGRIKDILEQVGHPEVMSNIHVKDYIGFKDLPCVYNLAKLYMYPSLRESFGLPIIEAMSCGTPVITSNTSSMPEVAGGAAVLIDPGNTQEMASAMTTVLSDTTRYQQLVNAGLERAKEFEWSNTARHVLDIYLQHRPTSKSK